MNMINMLMASGGFWNVWPVIKIVALVVMVLCALFIILVVLFQPGNSTGIDALGGSSETFFGKNKGRSMESKMKKWTIIVLVILAVLALVFFILQFDTIWWIGYERP